MCTIYIQKLSMGQQLNDRYTENTAGKISGAEITKKYDQQAVLVVKSDWGGGGGSHDQSPENLQNSLFPC